jgi:hypothetical protein
MPSISAQFVLLTLHFEVSWVYNFITQFGRIMFNKLAIVASTILLSACSSYIASSDYENDVIVDKQQQENYTQIIGKEIAPVDLIEPNLALKVSILSVTANVSDAQQQPVDSVVNFTIEYVQPKSEDQQIKQYDIVLIDEQKITLKADDVARDCEEQTCTISQNIAFPVATDLLQNSLEHGVKFSLKQQGDDKSELETMIPSRYLTALFATK